MIPYAPPFPTIERVELVKVDEAYRSVEQFKPLITDRYGDWFVVKCRSASRGGFAVARLRLAISVDGIPDVTLAELRREPYAVDLDAPRLLPEHQGAYRTPTSVNGTAADEPMAEPPAPAPGSSNWR